MDSDCMVRCQSARPGALLVGGGLRLLSAVLGLVGHGRLQPVCGDGLQSKLAETSIFKVDHFVIVFLLKEQMAALAA